MPEIFRNGKNYGAAMPNGGLQGQALVKISNGDGDVGWGDAGGAVFCYVIGSTPYASDWLSLTPTGTALVPNPKLIYLILTEGQYYHNFVRWDTTTSVYVPVSSGGGGVIVNATLLASGWNASTKQQTLTFDGYQASMGGVIGMPASATAAQKEAYSNAIIDVVAQSGNQFTFECQNIPDVDLPVTIYAGGGSGGGGTGGGHVIVSADGTEMEQREKLKFTGGAKVTDDSSNEETVVDISSKSDLKNLASAFAVTSEYSKDDRVTYNGKLYRFTADHTGAWDIADVVEVDVDTEFQGIKGLVGDTSDLTTIHKTDLVSAVNELNSDKQDVIMKSTMPTASADLVGKTFQYIGATNNDFKHNFFYECVEDSGTYKWENTDVQEATVITVDSALDDTSENPVQNKVIKGALDGKQDTVFVGTHLAWAALSDDDKAKFTLVNFTDDSMTDKINTSLGFTPVGTVISVMGTSAPQNYLACDGSVYNISSYPELADYFEGQFGIKNHFGGDGTTTFAVPDLRGEFLRGTGTNSHTNQGSGANVGVHQDGTEIPYVQSDPTSPSQLMFRASTINNEDSTKGIADHYYYQKATIGTAPSTSYYTSRPTNTSVLYCIATKNIYVDARFDYSLEEKVVGTWIDGKSIYQKVFTGTWSIPYVSSRGALVGVTPLLTGVTLIQAFGIGTVNSFTCCTELFVRTMANEWDLYCTNDIDLDAIVIQYTKTTD